MEIKLDNIMLDLGGKRVLDGISFSVADGEFVSLLGASGAGKSTTLKVIAGLTYQDSGEVSFDGRVIDEVPTHKRKTAIVFQDIRLFPNMDVAANVAFPLKMQGVPKAERLAVAEEMLEHVQLGGYGSRAVGELSGGQQQRVALARALAGKPHALLLDEPFSGLDEGLRSEMRELVLSLQQRLGVTAIMVTHDASEALVMSDRIVYLADGSVQQIAAPGELCLNPATDAVARSFGESLVIEGEVAGGVFTRGKLEVPAPECPDGRAVFVRLSNGSHFIEGM